MSCCTSLVDRIASVSDKSLAVPVEFLVNELDTDCLFFFTSVTLGREGKIEDTLRVIRKLLLLKIPLLLRDFFKLEIDSREASSLIIEVLEEGRRPFDTFLLSEGEILGRANRVRRLSGSLYSCFGLKDANELPDL